MTRAELFKVLSDPTRLRILALLHAEELSVGELQDVLGLGQSTVSGHLAQLKAAELVTARRDGPHTRYSPAVPPGEAELARLASEEPLGPADRHALERVREARGAPPPESLGPDFLPGRSWEALAQLLLELLPPLRFADLGVGTGRLTRLLAQHAAHVIAVDRDPEALAALDGIETRLGEIDAPPISPGEVDVLLLSQSLHCVEDPAAALRACFACLAPGGRVVVLDLAPHQHAWVRHRLGHRHLGFADLGGLLGAAGFVDVRARVVHRDRTSPAFTTVLAIGRRP